MDGADGWVPAEPSTIWTTLEVSPTGKLIDPPPAPSYRELAPRQRWFYLNWLRQPRLQPSVPAPYGMLYYYCLERRIFGPQHSRAAAEILRLREIFPNHVVLQLLSSQVIAAGWLFHRQYETMAQWLQGRPAFLPAAARNALSYFLLSAGIKFVLPVEWLLHWVLEVHPRQRLRQQALAEIALKEFADRVGKLLAAGSMLDRFRSALGSTKSHRPRLRLLWYLANPSRPFQSLEPLAIPYDPVFVQSPFLDPFALAWKKSLRFAAEEAQAMKRREHEKQIEETEEEIADKAWEKYVRKPPGAGGPRTGKRRGTASGGH